jgi:hypothetical protein
MPVKIARVIIVAPPAWSIGVGNWIENDEGRHHIPPQILVDDEQ